MYWPTDCGFADDRPWPALDCPSSSRTFSLDRALANAATARTSGATAVPPVASIRCTRRRSYPRTLQRTYWSPVHRPARIVANVFSTLELTQHTSDDVKSPFVTVARSIIRLLLLYLFSGHGMYNATSQSDR